MPFITRVFKYLLNTSNYLNDIHILRVRLRGQAVRTSVEQSWSTEPNSLTGVSFFDWFDAASSMEEVQTGAINDFDYAVSPFIPVSSSKSVCEIGFGGGRLANIACSRFKEYYGIDVHDNFSLTAQYLSGFGHNNYRLVHQNDIDTIPQFDCAYSFIVIQHFQNIQTLVGYLDFLASKLRPGGVAVLWYAKLKLRFLVPRGYYEVSPEKFRLRECSLYITPEIMAGLVCKRSFTVVSHSIDNLSSNGKKQSMQARIVIRKMDVSV